MTKIVCDIETNEIPPGNAAYPTTIWCICTTTLDGQDKHTFKLKGDHNGSEARRFKEYASEVTKWIGHNFLNFDRHVLNQQLGLTIKEPEVTDTLILSRLFLTERPAHSLDSWGKDLGFNKIDFKDFSKYSPEMVTYCENDVELNRRVLHELLKAGKGFSNTSVRLEHRTEEILNQIRLNGWMVDIDRIKELQKEIQGKLDDFHNNLDTLFPPRKVLKKEFTLEYTKKGDIVKRHQKYLADPGCEHIEGTTYRVYTMEPFNPNSHPQKIQVLDEAGWKPYLKTKSGKGYMVCEENLATLPPTAPESVKRLSEMQMLKSRNEKLLEWIAAYNPNTGRIHGNIISIGAITHRMAHRNPQMGNITATRHAYGTEMRECWICPMGRVVVGIDISNIQLAVLAHYMNDPVYLKAVESGRSVDKTDIHNVNLRTCEGLIKNRDDAKTTIYALLLGAGDHKLGIINGGGAPLGRKIRDTLFEKIPGFKVVQRMCAQAAERGYMNAVDGRRIPIKSEHYALSSYLQGTEAIIMKKTLELFSDWVLTHDVPCRILACVHDEIQVETDPDWADVVGSAAVDCITEAGEYFKLRLAITGEYNIGNNWAETH